MAATTTLQVQVDAEVASQATAVLKRQGMDVPQAMELLLGRIARDGGFLLEPGENAAYDAWFRAQVQEAFDDPRPLIPHEEVKRRWAIRRAKLLAEAEAQERCA